MEKISRTQKIKHRKPRGHLFLKAFVFTLAAVALIITGYLLAYLANNFLGQFWF